MTFQAKLSQKTDDTNEAERLFALYYSASKMGRELTCASRDETTIIMHNAVVDIAEVSAQCQNDIILKALMLRDFAEPADTDALSSLIHSICSDIIDRVGA